MNCNGRLLDLSKPRVMGILNITPDSFYEASRMQAADDIAMNAEKMLKEGADILDLGAYSSRPGALDVSVEEELSRLIPAVQLVHRHFPEAIISIDTFRAEVAKAAATEGADIINDISGGMDDEYMIETVAALKLPYILMHKRGTPADMQGFTDYRNVSLDILGYFQKQIAICREAGIKDLVLDPGFGFAKTLEQNYQLLRELDVFEVLTLPLLVGVSRKSMIQKVIGKTATEALNGTTALHMAALMKGASILRVHDVQNAVEVVKLFCALKGSVD